MRTAAWNGAFGLPGRCARAVLAEHALEPDRFVRRGQRIDGLAGIELRPRSRLTTR